MKSLSLCPSDLGHWHLQGDPVGYFDRRMGQGGVGMGGLIFFLFDRADHRVMVQLRPLDAYAATVSETDWVEQQRSARIGEEERDE